MRIALIALAALNFAVPLGAASSVAPVGFRKISEHLYESPYPDSVVIATFPRHVAASRGSVIFDAIANTTNEAAPIRIHLTRPILNLAADDTSRTLRFLLNGEVVQIAPAGSSKYSDGTRESTTFALSYEQALALLRRPRSASFGAIDFEWGDAAPYAREFILFVRALRED